MIKIKLGLKELDGNELADFLNLVGGKLDGNATFPASPIAPDGLSDDGDNLRAKIAARDALLQQAQQMTLAIEALRNTGEGHLNLVATYAEGVINTLVPPATIVDPVIAAEKARSAGFAVAEGFAPVGPMPKVTGLTATQGDADGEVDLHWAPVKRGLSSYTIQISEDPAGLTGWTFLASVSKSSYAAKGLVSGKRYWFRIIANGTAGPGPNSDPATKTAA